MREACAVLLFGLLISLPAGASGAPKRAEDGGLWSQFRIAEASIKQRDEAAADAACENLVADFADDDALPYAVYLLGKAYESTHEEEQAEECYRCVVEQWPQSVYAPWAHLAIFDSREADEAEPEVRSMLAQLMDMLPQQELSIEDIYNIAQRLRERRPERALTLYRYNYDQWPMTDESVLLSHIEIIRTQIINGDDRAADETFQTLLSRYAEREDLAELIYRVGNFYTENGQYDRAEDLFASIDRRWPNGQETLFAQVGRARLQLDKGNPNETEAIFQQMITDYADAPRLVEAIRLVGVGYWRQAMLLSSTEPGVRRRVGQEASSASPPAFNRSEVIRSYFGKAANAYDRIINDFPEDAIHTPFAYYYGGEAWSMLGDRQKAIAYHEKLCEFWPDHERVSYARYKLGRFYRRQAEEGIITPSEAESKTKAQYQRLLEDSPSAPMAAAARSWLDTRALMESRRDTSAQRERLLEYLSSSGKD